MPVLDIPESDRAGLAIFRKMSDDVLNALLAEINRSPGPVPVVENLSPGDAEQVMDAIKSMYRVRAYTEISLDKFISDICEVLRKDGELKENEEPQFRERLMRALDVQALNIAAKAFTLHTEYEHLFCEARILTDARPVYGENVSESPKAMIITHTLKIYYHETAGRPNEIYIGLGSNDIKTLRTILDRAEEKARSLQNAFETSKIPFIDPQQE